MRWSGILVLVACGGSSDPVDKPSNTGEPAPVTTKGSAPPVGWKEVTPTEDSLRCANRANDEWELSLDAGQVVATKQDILEPSRGPKLPFEINKEPGRRSVVAVSDGYLVGRDAGEWGGDLIWVAKDGTEVRPLGDVNVALLVDLGDSVLSLEGLAHLGTDEGGARWLQKEAGFWTRVATAPLDGAPHAYARVGDDVYVLTTKSLLRLGKDRTAKVIVPVPTGALYPDSGVADGGGTLWFGMRHYVLQLVPAGDTFTPHWYELSPACT